MSWASSSIQWARGAAAATLLLSSSIALAQPFGRQQRLLLSEGTLRGSPRVMGISGAYVGLAEGAEGLTRNPAAGAAKDPTYKADFNFDFAFTMHFLPPGATAEQDWDNDGLPDQSAAGPFAFLGTQVIYVVGAVQWKSVAFGLGVDLQNFLNRTDVPGDTLQKFHNVSYTHAFGTVSASLWYDQILVGAGLESSHAFVGYGEQRQGDFIPSPKDAMAFHGWGVMLGALYRPENADWRVGVSYKPQLVAPPAAPRDDIGGKIAPAGVDVPGRLSLGGAIALGKGRRLNITSPLGWVPRDPENPASAKTAAMTKWLLTAQLDVFFPVQGATLVGAFLQQPDFAALPAGYQVSVQPRLGVEKELFIDLLRLRGGTYFEPPVTTTGPLMRPHVTFGVELYLFTLGRERVSFGFSMDLANRYMNMSFGFLVWK